MRQEITPSIQMSDIEFIAKLLNCEPLTGNIAIAIQDLQKQVKELKEWAAIGEGLTSYLCKDEDFYD